MNIEDYFKITGTYELVDGLYNVKGTIRLIKLVEKLPVKFGIVSGTFNCSCNKLTSLEGTPNSVGRHFWCNDNKFTSLKGAPKKVGGDFWCPNNLLNSLEGSSISVGGDFWCNRNNLTSLEGCPTKVGGYFNCDKELHNTKEYKQFKILEKLRK